LKRRCFLSAYLVISPCFCEAIFHELCANIMSKSYYLETFGCQMNVVDSEWMESLLRAAGYTAVAAARHADVVILNTCSVRDKAQRKVYGHLGSFKPYKQRNPAMIIAVGGCVAQQEGERLLRDVPHVDIVFGTHNVHKLPQLIAAVAAGGGQQCAVEHYPGSRRLRHFPRRDHSGAVSRFVTIMQGCDNFCSYCVVPYVRGREVSRASGEIIAEVSELVDNGVKEITLLGQNVNSYARKGDADISFAELLGRLHAINGLERLRFTSSHPKDVDDELIDCFASLNKLCPHLHLALQSGSDRVLHAMNRGYDSSRYLDIIARLRQRCAHIRFTTDLIVGFPGESEADFLATIAVIKQVRFADAYTFLYSPRPYTAALKLADDVTAAEKQRRFDHLLQVQGEISAAVWGGDLGQTQQVLVEGPSPRTPGKLFGRSAYNRIIHFDAGDVTPGQLLPVRVEQVLRNSHLGRVVALARSDKE